MISGTATSLLAHTTQSLTAAGIENPRSDARTLIALAANVPPDEIILRPERELTAQDIKTLDSFVRRRINGEPISRIRGERQFWKHTYHLSPYTLDPRPESETIVSAVKALVRSWTEPPQFILDLGTGSGCLLLSLLLEFPAAAGVGVDLESQAIATAKMNVDRLGFADRVALVVGDWTAGLGQTFDVIVCNPPYIRTGDIANLQDEVRLFDPLLALDGGEDGLACYRKLLPGCRDRLRAGGVMAVEIGAGQSNNLKTIIRENGFDRIAEHSDLAGHVRCLSFFNAQKKG